MVAMCTMCSNRDGHVTHTISYRFASAMWTQHCFRGDVRRKLGRCSLILQMLMRSADEKSALISRGRRSSCDGRWGIQVAEQLLVQSHDSPDVQFGATHWQTVVDGLVSACEGSYHILDDPRQITGCFVLLEVRGWSCIVMSVSLFGLVL